MGYEFSIEYKKGSENSPADALSTYTKKSTIFAISNPILAWLDSIKDSVSINTSLKYIVNIISTSQLSCHWEFSDGLMFYKNRIYLLATLELTTPLLKSSIKDHEGYYKILQRLQAAFFWFNMKDQIHNIIQMCDAC